MVSAATAERVRTILNADDLSFGIRYEADGCPSPPRPTPTEQQTDGGEER